MVINKVVVEKILIILSSFGLFTFLFPELTYLRQFYISIFILIYTIYLFISKVNLRISSTVIILLILSFFIFCQIYFYGEFEYKILDYYTLIISLIFFQFNKLIFIKHTDFAIKSILVTIIVFNLIFVAKLFLSQYDIIYNIEYHFDNIGLYAIFLTLSAIILLTYCDDQLNKIVIGVFIITIGCIIVMLESRTALVILVSYMILYFLRKLKSSNVKYYIGLGILLLIVAFLSFNTKTNSSHGRFFIWKTTSCIIKDHSLTGIGYNNFPAVYPIYQASMYTDDKMTQKEVYLVDNVKVAFNEYIHITAELGIIGLIISLSFIIIYLHYSSQKIILFCICIAMIFSYILHSPIIIFLIILILSLTPIPIEFKLNRTASIILLIIMTVFVGNNIYFLLNKYKCNSTVNILCAKSPDLLNEYYSDNKRYLCDNIKILFIMADFNYRHNMVNEALTSLSQLDNLIKRNDIELLKAKCYIEQGEYKLAEKHLKLSVAMCPNRFITRYELFKFYVNLKMKDNAIQVAKDIHRLDQKVISSHTVAIKKEIEEYMEKHNISQ